MIDNEGQAIKDNDGATDSDEPVDDNASGVSDSDEPQQEDQQ